MSARACIDVIKSAGRGLLDDDTVDELLGRVQDRIDRARAERQAARADVALREGVAKDAEALRLEAALARKHAALTILARKRVMGQVATFRAAGLDPRKSVLALLEGTARGVPGARDSVAAKMQGYRGAYLGRMFRRLDELGPRVIAAVRDQGEFQANVVREMRARADDGTPAGTPGVTGDPLARQVADILAESADEARRDLNRLGGAIGELAGWSPQAHDRAKIAKTPRDQWIETTLAKLDVDKSFQDADGDLDHVRGILSEMYDNIVSDVDAARPQRDEALAASRVTPTPNLARALGRHRVLHFKDADSWLDYRTQFGAGHVFDAMVKHLERAARTAGQMEVLGPNPGYTLQTTLDELRQQIRADRTIPAEQKDQLAKALRLDGNDGVASAFAEMQGLTFGVGGSETAARIMSETRAWQGVAKLGGAFISSFFSDPWVQATNLRFLGRSWGDAIASQVRDFVASAPSRERRRLAWQLGQGFDTLAQRISTSYFIHDGAPGVMQQLLNWTMRYQGLSWFTDHLRGTGARLMAEDLGDATVAFERRGWGGIDERLRHALELHNIGAGEVQALASVRRRHDGGRRFVTPDLARELEDDVVAELIAERLARAEEAAAARARADAYKRAGTTAAKATADQRRGAESAAEAAREATRARLLDGERRRVELALQAYFADELRSFSVLEPTAQTRRLMLRGSRRGTAAGEILRALATFKSYPVGFTTGPLARQIHGGPG
ncbi:MAG: hypothetical protein ACOCUS_07055, partial [Polyangiales bacterium]